MSFGFNCSQGALKSIAVSSSGLYLSCGGTDERIRLFNVAENRSMGELGLHEGAITALEFFEDSHMISGSDVRTLNFYIPIVLSAEYGLTCNIVCSKIPNMKGYDAENLAMP
jgi:WD40 repeat protein